MLLITPVKRSRYTYSSAECQQRCIRGLQVRSASLRIELLWIEALIRDKLATEYEHLQFLREEAGLKSALLEDKSSLAKAQSALREAEDNKMHYNSSFRVEIQENRTVLEYLVDPFLDPLSQGFQEK